MIRCFVIRCLQLKIEVVTIFYNKMYLTEDNSTNNVFTKDVCDKIFYNKMSSTEDRCSNYILLKMFCDKVSSIEDNNTNYILQ